MSFLGDQLGEEVRNKIVAWHVCKTLPDTGNPDRQAREEEVDRLKKLC